MSEEHPVSRAVVWLRVAMWILPGCILFVGILLGDRLLKKFHLAISDAKQLWPIVIVSISFVAGICDALLRRKLNRDYATSLVRIAILFCLFQFAVIPLICVTLGFAWCCVNPIPIK